MADPVLCDVKEDIATLILNRPEKLNAIDYAMADALTGLLDRLATDDRVKAIIAAVNGLAYGGGCEITEAAHLAIASDRARFAKSEIRLGMPPTFGGTQRLPRLAGRKRALELLLSGEPFSPAKAFELGLVNHVVPHEELLQAARDMARRVARHQAPAAAAVLRAVTRGLNATIDEGLAIEGEQFARLVGTTGLNAGLTAWLERKA